MLMLSFMRRYVAFAAIITAVGCGVQGLPSRSGVSPQESGARRPPSNSGYKLLYSFQGGKDGQDPWASLLYYDGRLYGTTAIGGDPKCDGGYLPGCGTVFTATTAGRESVLYRFAGPRKDGMFPYSSVIELKGKLYGTTWKGGETLYGTVYVVTTNGKERVLHSFTQSDGANPRSGLLAVGSILYGTTSDGGDHSCDISYPYCGTIFSISTAGKVHVLYDFKRFPDGSVPNAGLTEVNGSLFGVTENGGAGEVGAVFRSSLSGKERVIYSFYSIKSPDGEFPSVDLTLVKGKLYSTTSFGGASGAGTVFEVTPSGKEQLLYSFKGEPDDGRFPLASLVEARGNLYGVTLNGGAHSCYAGGEGCGTVFKVSPNGQETVLYEFKGGTDGAAPIGGLIEVNGRLYGTTSAGGSGKCPARGNSPAGCGTIFTISP